MGGWEEVEQIFKEEEQKREQQRVKEEDESQKKKQWYEEEEEKLREGGKHKIRPSSFTRSKREFGVTSKETSLIINPGQQQARIPKSEDHIIGCRSSYWTKVLLKYR